jgi:molybdopterin biosynthesis enzyme MoaB
MIQVVSIEDAVGFPLAHDITEIRPGEFKGPAFQRGHILRDQDLEYLRRLGKNHLYILKLEKDEMHEDDAAEALANALCGPGVGWQGVPREGKIALSATRSGLFKVDVAALLELNLLGDVMCATKHSNSVVKKGERVASTRAIPLVIARSRVEQAVQAAQSAASGVLRVMPLKRARVGVMITGDEVYSGRIKDKFEPVIRQKVAQYQGLLVDLVFLPDDDARIAEAAHQLIAKKIDVIITTGGMSVDPDDRTRFALKKAGVRDVVYGSAVQPGAMFMIAYLDTVPVLSIPACGIYAATTIFDLIYPRVLAGEKIERRDVALLGHGGLCQKCTVCTFPRCAFGK